MELYKSRSTWRVLLAIFGMIIVIITSFYSYYLATQLAEKELKAVRLFSLALEEVYANEDLNASVAIPNEIITNNTVPIVLENEDGELEGFNYPEDKLLDQEYLKKQVEKSKKRFDPIDGTGYSRVIYLNYSRLYNLIRLYPIVQVSLVAIFIFLGYLVFSASRREEQNRVWAGMAKETAHQLGTPISAILGWLEMLKVDDDITEEQLSIVGELSNDVDRLNLVADRFSKIGSEPKLDRYEIFEILQNTKEYMEKRASRKVTFNFPQPQADEVYVQVNEHLFVWVLENLMRNALDAMEGKGEISASVSTDVNNVVILLSDTGKGIPESKQKTVFKPGYSTKTRGWGLGLSLAKRIIEQYHNGKIFVKNSKLNEGTTFQINLPKTA